MDKETAKQKIKELVKKYKKIVEENRVSKYNEEMTKKDFILPCPESPCEIMTVVRTLV